MPGATRAVLLELRCFSGDWRICTEVIYTHARSFGTGSRDDSVI